MALRGTQRHSEAIRGTRRHLEALRGTRRHSEALSDLGARLGCFFFTVADHTLSSSTFSPGKTRPWHNKSRNNPFLNAKLITPPVWSCTHRCIVDIGRSHGARG